MSFYQFLILYQPPSYFQVNISYILSLFVFLLVFPAALVFGQVSPTVTLTGNKISLLKAFEAVDTKALLITDGSNENVALSARNMPKVTTITNMGLNCFDILNSKKVFLAKDAVEKIEEVLA